MLFPMPASNLARFPMWEHVVPVSNRYHVDLLWLNLCCLLVTILALCTCGALGKGMLCTYPFFIVPTHPFIVLGLCAWGNYLGEFSICKYHGLTLMWWTPGDVCSSNLPDSPAWGASLGHTYSVQSYLLPKRITFPSNANIVIWLNYLRCRLLWCCCSALAFLVVDVPFPLGWVRK